MRGECYKKDAQMNIKYVGYYSMRINEEISTNSVKEAIQNRDAEIVFREYASEKFKHNAEFLDLDTRDAFRCKGINISVIKCPYSYNQYRVRDAMINGSLTGI